MSGRLVYLPSAFAAPALAVLLHFLCSGRRGVFLAAAGALAAVFAFQLYRLNLRWQAAGDLARRCTDAAAAASGPGALPIAVLDAPDSLYPAFVLRNGLPEAVRLFHADVTRRVDVATTVTLFSPSDAVAVTGAGDTYRLRRPPERNGVPLFFAAGGEGFSVHVAPDAAAASVRLSRKGFVLVYTAGTLRPWSGRQPS